MIPAQPKNLPATDSGKIPLNPLRRSFRKALQNNLKRHELKIKKLQLELAECDKREEILQSGEILKVNLSQIKRGMTSVILPDLYNNLELREISLEAKLSPQENLRKIFQQHRKLTKRVPHLTDEIARASAEAAAIGDLLQSYLEWESLAQPGDPPALELVEQAGQLHIHVDGLTNQKESLTVRKGVTEWNGARQFTSLDGLLILVGKTATDNDYLTFRIAKGNDWWLHCGSGNAGSHVVVKDCSSVNKDGSLPKETLLDAAHLAVYFSKARNATKVEVTIAQAKQLHKGKKAPPGQVIVRSPKNLLLRIEESRLERLLERHTRSN